MDSFEPLTTARGFLHALSLEKARAAFRYLRGESKIEAMQLGLDRLLSVAGLQIQFRTATVVDELNIKISSMKLNPKEGEY